jgi:hypothetical protein
MTQQSLTGRTQDFTARTQSFNYQPSRATLAARSLHEVDRMTDPDARRKAFVQHMDAFPPTITSY